MKNKLLLLCLLPLLFGGCWDQQIFEENTIVLSTGIEQAEENFTYTFVSEGGASDDEKLHLNSVNSRILSEAIVKANKENGTPLQAGKIQTILLSESVAQRGFTDLIENHKMEDVNRFLPDYVITESPPFEIYQCLNAMKLGEHTFTYIDDLLRNAAENGYCPDILARDYDIDFYNKNPDPILPLITTEKEEPVVVGTALFRNHRMVGKLTPERSAFLLLVTNKNSQFSYIMDTPNSEKDLPILFKTNRCNSSVTVKIEGETVHIHVTENICGIFDKLVWANLSETFGYDMMEQYLIDYYEKNTIESLLQIQTLNSDPLGIKGLLTGFHGDFAATHDIDTAYHNAKITVTAKVNIKNSAIPQ